MSKAKARDRKNGRSAAAEAVGTQSGSYFGRHVAVIAFMLTAITLAVYLDAGKCSFISFDDPAYVTDNYRVKQGLTLAGTKWAFTSFDASNWHPLTWLSHMLDVQLFGMQPEAHHLVNVFFHITNVLLLFLLLLWMTRRLWASAFVAALFALHPLHVESVAWVAERKDVLSTCFWLSTILAYVSYVRKGSVSRYCLVLSLFALGLMTKPMVVTLPIILLLLDRWPLERKLPWRQLIIEKVPLVALSCASCLVTMVAQRHAMFEPAAQMTAMTMTNAIASYGRYVLDMFWPTGLAPYYPIARQPVVAAAALAGALVAAVTVVAIRYRDRFPYLATGWFWYLVTLVPVAGFLQVGDHSHADRYTYIPSIGFFVIVAFVVADIVGKRPALRAVAVVLAIGVLGASAYATNRYVNCWKDSYTLFRYASEVVPGTAKIETSLGASLWKMGRLDEAASHLQKAIDCGWHDGSPFTVMGRVYLDKGDYKRAIEYFGQAAKFQREAFEAEYGMGGAFFESKDYASAVSSFTKAAALNDNSAKVQSMLAISLSRAGRGAEALRAVEAASRLDPADAMTLFARGYVLAEQGDLAAAAQAYRASARADHNVLVYRNLALVLERMNDRAGALESIGNALKMDPENPEYLTIYRRLGGSK